MKKIALAGVLVASTTLLFAQSKKELQTEVTQLKTETQTLKKEIEELKKPTPVLPIVLRSTAA